MASETDGCWNLLERAKERLGYRPKTFGADKGYFAEAHIEKLLGAGIEPHIAVDRGAVRRGEGLGTGCTASAADASTECATRCG